MKLKFLKKTIATISIAAMMAMSLSGCGEKSTSSPVLLTVGEETVTLGEAYFLIKLQQAQYETIASQYYGESWYSSDLFGTGETFQDYYKRYFIEILERVCLARQHMDELGVELTAEETAAIEKTADAFLEDNVKSARKAMKADRETIINVLTGHKILEKVTAKAVEGVNQDISDEELRNAAYTKTYSYIYTPLQNTESDGTMSDMTTAEREEAISLLNNVREEVLAGADFDMAATGQGLSVSQHIYTPNDETDKLIEINKEMDKLQIGEVSGVIPLDTTGIFIGHMDSDNTNELADEEVISIARENILNERKYEMFKGIVEGWRADVEVTLDEGLWSQVSMEKPLKALTEE